MLERPGENHGEQQGEQDLLAGLHGPQLLQQLHEVPIGPLLRPLTAGLEVSLGVERGARGTHRSTGSLPIPALVPG